MVLGGPAGSCRRTLLIQGSVLIGVTTTVFPCLALISLRRHSSGNRPQRLKNITALPPKKRKIEKRKNLNVAVSFKIAQR